MTMKRLIYVIAFAAIAVGAASAGWYAWQKQLSTSLPDGIVSVNGRLEATEVDIATKLPGRVADIALREGDTVEMGAVVARMDSAETEAQLRQAEAEAERARQSQAAAQALVEGRRGDLVFAEQQFERVVLLSKNGIASHEKHDQQQQQLAAAKSAVSAAEAQVAAAVAAIAAADASVEHMRSLLAETEIKAPVRGRVQYRLAEPGSVLAAGGRIALLLDLSDVSMTVFLPAYDAGRLVIGDEARVVLDAAPGFVFPVKVDFVSAEAQFTPKSVETAAEREKLMFRVKLRAPQEVLAKYPDRVLSGLRGLAYVRVDRTAQWPDWLSVKLPEK